MDIKEINMQNEENVLPKLDFDVEVYASDTLVEVALVSLPY